MGRKEARDDDRCFRAPMRTVLHGIHTDRGSKRFRSFHLNNHRELSASSRVLIWFGTMSPCASPTSSPPLRVAGTDVQESPHYPAGMALRFARVKRYRDDKTAAEADTIGTVRKIFEGGRGS